MMEDILPSKYFKLPSIVYDGNEYEVFKDNVVDSLYSLYKAIREDDIYVINWLLKYYRAKGLVLDDLVFIMNQWYAPARKLGSSDTQIYTLYDAMPSLEYSKYKDNVFNILQKLVQYGFYPEYKVINNAINTGNVECIGHFKSSGSYT